MTECCACVSSVPSSRLETNTSLPHDLVPGLRSRRSLARPISLTNAFAWPARWTPCGARESRRVPDWSRASTTRRGRLAPPRLRATADGRRNPRATEGRPPVDGVSARPAARWWPRLGDAEGDLLEHVRARWPTCVIAVELDPHCRRREALRTRRHHRAVPGIPATDFAERGEETVELVLRAIRARSSR